MAKDSLRFTRRLMLSALVFTPAVFAADRFYDEMGRYTGQNRGGVTVQGAAMTPRAATSGAAMTRAFKNETGPKTGRQSTSVLRL